MAHVRQAGYTKSGNAEGSLESAWTVDQIPRGRDVARFPCGSAARRRLRGGPTLPADTRNGSRE